MMTGEKGRGNLCGNEICKLWEGYGLHAASVLK